MKRYSNETTKEKGAVYILLTVLILSAILAISIVITNITLYEIRMSESVRRSIPAYFAGESGIEEALYYIRIQGLRPSPSLDVPFLTGSILGGEATYEVYIVDTDPELIMKSIGEYSDVRRAVEITFKAVGW